MSILEVPLSADIKLLVFFQNVMVLVMRGIRSSPRRISLPTSAASVVGKSETLLTNIIKRTEPLHVHDMNVIKFKFNRRTHARRNAPFFPSATSTWQERSSLAGSLTLYFSPR